MNWWLNEWFEHPIEKLRYTVSVIPPLFRIKCIQHKYERNPDDNLLKAYQDSCDKVRVLIQEYSNIFAPENLEGKLKAIDNLESRLTNLDE